MKPILEVSNVGKKFLIHHLPGGYLSLREKIWNSFKFQKNHDEEFWALKDISFSVMAGESVGIIGKNGAGKSTLLKILSRITPPTNGTIITRGRIASLLEVGTGFHPELTGRENIFFNGSLLGLKKKEIQEKFGEIVDFSGTEKFLDTPLKHFSSGMQLRLAFSVAAFLEPEIFVIDEVLAVGDAEFQKKCMGKMADVSKNGRTILFVSHDLSALEKLCSRTILLHAGSIHMMADTTTVLNHYLNIKLNNSVEGELIKGVKISQFVFGEGRIISNSTLPFTISLTYENKRPLITEFCILIYAIWGTRVAIVDLRDHLQSFDYLQGQIVVRGEIDRLNLVEGDYQIGLHFAIDDNVGEAQDLTTITVTDNSKSSVRRYQPKYRGVMELEFKLW